MLVLHEFQKQFIRGLFNNSDSIFSCIDSTQELPSLTKLEIYRSSIIGALQKSLLESFPVCCKLVGKDFFIAIVNDYISATFSSSPDLGDYGNHFPEFIKYVGNTHIPPYLADVASLEWAWHKIFNAPNYLGLDLQKLQEESTKAGDYIVFFLPPQSCLLTSPYPIHRIWEMNQESGPEYETLVLKKNIQYYFFIWRHELETRIDEITYLEWQILSWIQSGHTIAEICQQAQKYLSDTTIISLLMTCMQKKWIVDFKVSSTGA